MWQIDDVNPLRAMTRRYRQTRGVEAAANKAANKRELKGSELDNPGHDELVEGTRAALVLLIGRQATHVPKVQSNTRNLRQCAHA